MTQLLDWLTKYSPAVVLLLAFGAGLLFVIKLIVEKSIASEFDAKSKVFEVLLKRRSAFEEKVLSDRFALITGLSARLEHVMTNLNRLHSGQPAPDGFMKQNEIVPLTEIFEDIEIHRLVLGEDFHRLFSKQAQLALKVANVSRVSPEDWRKGGEEWVRLRQEIRLAAEAAFGISQIHW
jgi:hypothetical protein